MGASGVRSERVLSLFIGLAFSAVLIYLLIVRKFSVLVDPCHHTAFRRRWPGCVDAVFNPDEPVGSGLDGAIMCLGVATA